MKPEELLFLFRFFFRKIKVIILTFRLIAIKMCRFPLKCISRNYRKVSSCETLRMKVREIKHYVFCHCEKSVSIKYTCESNGLKNNAMTKGLLAIFESFAAC